MNKDLEVFENRRDDWLAKERKYEETISAWDLDEGKKIKIEHEMDCEAREIKRNHEIRHKAYDNQFVNLSELTKRKQTNINSQKTFLPIVLLFIFIPSILIITTFLLAFGVDVSEINLAMPIIIFIVLVNIFSKKKKEK